jgi:ribulose-5-phosphate 4-epimerase/fuculose-1-phosphate aldolase
MIHERPRERIVAYAQRMAAERLVQFTAGNVSCRVPDEPNLVAVTPGSLPYDEMGPDDVCIVTVDGELVEGDRTPTSELPLHTAIYLRRPDVHAVIHTHSPSASVLAVMNLRLPAILAPLVSAAGGDIETAPYARGATIEMVDRTAAALRDRSSCFLRQHGVLSIGPGLEDAYNAAAVVEHAASVFLAARAIGPVPELPPEEIARIRQKWLGRWKQPVFE